MSRVEDSVRAIALTRTVAGQASPGAASASPPSGYHPIALLPCPFCGNPNIEYDIICIECDNCGGGGGARRAIGEDGVLTSEELWNKRALLTQCVEALEVAADALDEVWADVKLGQRSGPAVSNARNKARKTLARARASNPSRKDEE